MNCPVCSGTNTGRVGGSVYYCATCLLEFSRKGEKTEIYYVDADGSTVQLNEEEAGRLVGRLEEGAAEGSGPGLLPAEEMTAGELVAMEADKQKNQESLPEE